MSQTLEPLTTTLNLRILLFKSFFFIFLQKAQFRKLNGEEDFKEFSYERRSHL